MTKEEREKAIDIFIKRAKCRATSIDNIIEGIGIKCGETACEECPLIYDDDELYEAERMALEALKQEPCEDAISRQALMSHIENERREWGEDYDLDQLLGDIEDFPSIIPTNKWIPVSERPPEELTPVNITWVNRNPEPYYKDIKDKPFTATGVYYKGKWYWYSSTCEDYLTEYGRNEVDRIDADIEVTAWMPIAEPYKESN